MTKSLLTLALLSAVCFAQAQPAKTAVNKPTTPAASATMPTSAAPAEDKEKKTEFVERLFSEQSYLNAQIVDKCFTFKLSPTC